MLLACAVVGCVPPARAQTVSDAGALRLEPAAVLDALAFDESGAFAGLAARDFWERVFEDGRVPEDPERELRGIGDASPIDAAYVLAATCGGPPAVGRSRLRALAFVQRVFGGRPHDPAAALVAARAVIRYPMLMLSVERMGLGDASVYAALSRAAGRLERITQPLRLRDALSQFQGAAALVERARLTGAMTPDAAGDALLALAAAPISRGGEFHGAIGRWLVEHLLPGLGVPVTPAFDSRVMDERLLAVLAGAAGAEPPVVEWEGLTFRFDRRAAQLERFLGTRGRLGGNRLDAVLALWAAATALAGGAGDPSELIDRLERSSASVRAPSAGLYVPRMRSIPYEDRIRPVVADLRAAAGRGGSALAEAAERLFPVVDVLLADLLRTLPYVVHLANGYGVELLGDDLPARHEFGVRIGDPAARARAPWSRPRGEAAPPVPFQRLGEYWTAPDGGDPFRGVWHVYGSLLSLDLALASFYLPRLANVMPPAVPAFTPRDEDHFAHGVTLFNASAVTPAQVGEIADAIRRGRARLQRLRGDPAALPDVARDAGLSAARTNELAWTVRRRPEAVDRFLSRTELLWLGLRAGTGGTSRPPAGWGAPTLWLDGCLCLRIPRPDGFDRSAAAAARVASRFADLPLALAEAVDDLGLPAPIVGDLLPLAMRELLDGVGATYAAPDTGPAADGGEAVELSTRRGRLDALVREVHALPRARVEDYVAALVGPGRPLRPIEPSP